MQRKKPFPPEPDTEPDLRRVKVARPESGPAPKEARNRSEAPTEPPPAKARETKAPRRSSSVRPPSAKSGRPGSGAATVDEVTADLSKDPRRERDDDD